MGIIGRSFVVAGLAIGTLVAGLVVGTEGSENEKGVGSANTLQVAVSKSLPPILMEGKNDNHLALAFDKPR